MERDTTSNSFVDRLEAHLLDNQGDLETIRDDLSAQIEEARFLGDDYRTDILDSLVTLIDRGEPDDADVLPLIFALREGPAAGDNGLTAEDGTAPVTGSAPDKSTGLERTDSPVAFEMPDDDHELFSLPAGTETLVRESERLGRQAFVIEVGIDPSLMEIAHETIESAYPVVHSILRTDGRLHVLVVADQQPQPTSRIAEALPEKGTPFDLKIRPIPYDLLNGSPSVAQSWYARVPAVRLTPQYETIERFFVLVREMERTHGDPAGAVWEEFHRTVSATFLLDLKAVFEEMRPTVAAIAHDFRKQITVRIGGDTDKVAASYADLLREIVFELVCNAIQHGIERPEERRAAGKAEAGTIHILLRETLGRLVIRIHDDGRGVNQEELKAAFSRHSDGGLGRIRATVASRFGGKLTLKTGERGTTAEIDVPYGPGVYRAVTFHRRGACFAAPATFVIATPELTQQSVVADSAGTPFVRIFGRVLPFLEAHSGEFVVNAGGVGPRHGVVLKVGSRECVLAADGLDGEAHAVPVNEEPGRVAIDGFDEPVMALPLERVLERMSPVEPAAETR
ncbi:MAG: ATP-binding protein [Spirochaeta sp.]|nr:ATP-binding protein [Spirochaeta sp.]